MSIGLNNISALRGTFLLLMLFWDWISVYSPGWPWTQRSACLCLPSAGTEGVCHLHLAAFTVFPGHHNDEYTAQERTCAITSSDIRFLGTKWVYPNDEPGFIGASLSKGNFRHYKRNRAIELQRMFSGSRWMPDNLPSLSRSLRVDPLTSTRTPWLKDAHPHTHKEI